MSVVIRLSRAGAKKRPFYRLVVADSRFPRDGRRRMARDAFLMSVVINSREHVSSVST